MSLIKQLWIAVALLMTLAFAGSFIVSTLSAKHYLEQQLQLKNIDNAASLALSMSQMEKDPVTIELLLAAQFDAGHYQRIRLTDPRGEVIQERTHEGIASRERRVEETNLGAPGWFVGLIPLSAEPGVAQVQDGWRQYGTLLVESHSRFAYTALWSGTLQLLQWFLLAAVGAGLLGTWVLKTITRPLDSVVAQAEAIGNRRFITSNEPRTLEFRSLARAMNTLSARVRTMLEKEARQLEEYRRQTLHDKVTGLANRDHFLNLLDTALSSPDSASTGTLLLMRVSDLAEVNRRLGHGTTDRLLAELAGIIDSVAADHPLAQSGRIKNSDFALLLPGIHDPAGAAERLSERLHELLDQYEAEGQIGLPLAAATYNAGDERGHLLARADGALAVAEQRGGRAVELLTDARPPAHANLEEWRDALTRSLQSSGVELGGYPVVDTEGQLLHQEAPARMHLDGELRNAGYFVPWAARLGMMPAIDLAVASSALDRIEQDQKPLGINLSADALRDAWFRSELFRMLQDAPDEARKLWIELPEAAALNHLAEFKALCLALHPIGCRMGLEHVGPEFARIGELHDLGLDYVKIDTSLIRDIDHNPGNQTFVRGLCTITHSIGLIAIAEGVRTTGEQTTLSELGVDGMTGPGVQVSASSKGDKTA